MYAFDIESYYDKELNVRELGAFNYLARADVYLVSFWGPDGGWVGHPSDVNWCWFKGSELWSHNRAFDGAFLAARGLPDPGGNCTSNLAAFLCGHHSLKDAAKVMFDVDVSKEMREEMEGVKWTDLSPERQQDLREYALRDAELCYRLATQFRDRWPEKEQRLSTHTINMCQRGIAVDLEYLACCKTRAEEIKAEAIKLIPWAGQFDEKGKEKKLLSANEMRAACARLGIPAPANFDASKAALRNWEAQYGEAISFRRRCPRLSPCGDQTEKVRGNRATDHAGRPHVLRSSVHGRTTHRSLDGKISQLFRRRRERRESPEFGP